MNGSGPRICAEKALLLLMFWKNYVTGIPHQFCPHSPCKWVVHSRIHGAMGRAVWIVLMVCVAVAAKDVVG